MSLPRTCPGRRLRIFAAGVGATALACAGLALMSPSTEAAPCSQPATAKTCYRGGPVHPASYMVTKCDGSTGRLRNNGEHLQPGTTPVKCNYSVFTGNDGRWH